MAIVGVNSILIAAKEGIQFLADSGSHCSVLPLFYQNLLCQSPLPNPKLSAANGTPIITNMHKIIKFTIDYVCETFIWDFIIADITQPILGLDLFETLWIKH